jgi:predicted TIM-barrel fold metal-dependent hydrolase
LYDSHVHFFSNRFFELLASQKPGLTVDAMAQVLGWQMPPNDPEQLAKRWLEDMDRHGVETLALIASLPGDDSSVTAAVTAYPERFIGYAMVNPIAGDACARTEKALREGRIKGVCLFPAMHGYFVHDPRVASILDLAQQYGAIVFVHCGVLSVGVRGKLGLASPFDMRYSNPIDLHPVALRYPELRFVIPHFGAGNFREALMVADLCPNIYLDTSSSNKWIRYQEAELTIKDVFRRALDVVGPRRLLFGTDSSFFPRGWHKAVFDEQANALREIGVSETDARSIFSENLRRLVC